MLWSHQTFLAGSPSAGRRTSIYSSARMPHLQNCATILNLRVLRMVGGGCGWRGMSKIKKNELGERDMVFRQRQKALSMSWQPLHRAGHEGLPVSLPGLVLRAPRLLTLLVLCWACPAVPVS